MQLRLWTYELPLRHRFTISRESIDVQPTLIVELEHEGERGYGEATANAYYGHTIQRLAEALAAIRPTLASWNPSEDSADPAQWWSQLHAKELQSEPFAHCALDQALWDLWARLRKKPLWELWGLDADRCPASNFTIGIDAIDTMVAKLQETPDWPCYKIKLGTEHDVEIVKRLREATDATFRVDANCGWSANDVIPLAQQLAPLGVEFIEQPLPPDQWEAMRAIYRDSPLPLAADESCQVPDDVARCREHFHIVNIKLVKCGGLTPARRMIENAKRLGLKTMVGCMTESTVGISSIAQLLPMLDYVDMDGANLLSQDIARGPQVVNGVCQLNREPGMGVSLTQQGRELLP